MRDALLAVVGVLKTDAPVMALTTNGLPGSDLDYRVFGQELPEDMVPLMPRRAIVVSRVPGVGGMVGTLELEKGLLNVLHYAETPKEAEELREATRAALKAVNRVVVANTLLHGLDVATAPAGDRDGDARWPYVIEAWTFLASEIVAP